MAKNKCFDFFPPFSSSSGDHEGNERNDVVKAQDEELVEVEKRLSCLQQRFHVAIQTMLETWEESASEHKHDVELVQNIANTWFNKLVSLHSQEERSYHTLCHLEEMFGFIDLILEHESDADTENESAQNSSVVMSNNPPPTIIVRDAVISLSIFFHDAVYDAKSSTNEEDSLSLYKSFEKDLFETTLSKTAGYDKGQVPHEWQFSKQIASYIIATKSHNIDTVKDTDKNDVYLLKYLKYFLDADMAVLGKQPSAYDHYASLIRKEYIHVPHDIYCQKRAEVLQSFVTNVTEGVVTVDGSSSCASEKAQGGMNNKEPKFIFASDIMRDALEEQAVSNLQREISSLKSGVIPA